MANTIVTDRSEYTSNRRYRIDRIIIDSDGSIEIPLAGFRQGAWHINGTFGAGGSVALQFSNDVHEQGANKKWSQNAVTLTEDRHFVEYYFGSFVQMRYVVSGFVGTIYSSIEQGGK